MFDKTITLFNYHADTQSWHTTVFDGADLIESGAANATQQGVVNSDAVDLLLPVSYEGGAISYGGKPYLKPKAYAASETPSESFTFSPETDFFMPGNHSSDTPFDETEYMDGFYTTMNAEHDDVYLISSAAFYSLIPHFEIGGR